MQQKIIVMMEHTGSSCNAASGRVDTVRLSMTIKRGCADGVVLLFIMYPGGLRVVRRPHSAGYVPVPNGARGIEAGDLVVPRREVQSATPKEGGVGGGRGRRPSLQTWACSAS